MELKTYLIVPRKEKEPIVKRPVGKNINATLSTIKELNRLHPGLQVLVCQLNNGEIYIESAKRFADSMYGG